MNLSKDQEKALEGIMAWWKKPKRQYISLGGYAGTGKTTLMAVLRKKLDKNKRVAFVSYTGKAARVLRSKLMEEKAMEKEDSVGTIHSLIYCPITNDKQEIVGWERKEKIETDLIVVDEASMVDGGIWADLLSYNVPIVATGDHGQLPPIRGNFNLMAKPDLILEEIHRQAADNPIIKVSVWARKTGMIPKGDYGAGVRKLDRREGGEEVEDILKNYNEEWMVLCGYNRTRVKLNQFIRNSREIVGGELVAGDRVICLRNNHEKQVFNGMLGTVASIEKRNMEWYEAEIEMDGEDEKYEGLVMAEQFGREGAINFSEQRFRSGKGDLFDFGYALTVHKAQGSQSKKVLLFEERFSKMTDDEWRRWLYTAVTRAESELIIVG